MTCNININFTANVNYQILLSQEFLLQIHLYNPQYHSSSVHSFPWRYSIITSFCSTYVDSWAEWVTTKVRVGKEKIKAPLMVLRYILKIFILVYNGTRSLPTLFFSSNTTFGFDLNVIMIIYYHRLQCVYMFVCSLISVTTHRCTCSQSTSMLRNLIPMIKHDWKVTWDHLHWNIWKNPDI